VAIPEEVDEVIQDDADDEIEVLSSSDESDGETQSSDDGVCPPLPLLDLLPPPPFYQNTSPDLKSSLHSTVCSSQVIPVSSVLFPPFPLFFTLPIVLSFLPPSCRPSQCSFCAHLQRALEDATNHQDQKTHYGVSHRPPNLLRARPLHFLGLCLSQPRSYSLTVDSISQTYLHKDHTHPTYGWTTSKLLQLATVDTIQTNVKHALLMTTTTTAAHAPNNTLPSML
jgi:hypothetical protein